MYLDPAFKRDPDPHFDEHYTRKYCKCIEDQYTFHQNVYIIHCMLYVYHTCMIMFIHNICISFVKVHFFPIYFAMKENTSSRFLKYWDKNKQVLNPLNHEGGGGQGRPGFWGLNKEKSSILLWGGGGKASKRPWTKETLKSFHIKRLFNMKIRIFTKRLSN